MFNFSNLITVFGVVISTGLVIAYVYMSVCAKEDSSENNNDESEELQHIPSTEIVENKDLDKELESLMVPDFVDNRTFFFDEIDCTWMEANHKPEKKKVNLPKKDAGRKLVARLKELGKQQPPKDTVKKINTKKKGTKKKNKTKKPNKTKS
jgi:hypothetical protein